jgi:hypothetical protein
MQPTKEQWLALYGAVSAFHKQAPWQWLSNGHIFGIENPSNREIGYITILGNGGEAFGLAVYLGTNGIRVLMDMLNGEVEEDPLFTQHCLLASLNDRDDLYPKERKRIKELGLSFRGRNAWPAFLYYEPGYVPDSDLTGEQAEWLTVALRQSMAVAEAYREQPDGLFHDDPTQILIRCPNPAAQPDAWTNEWRSLPKWSEEDAAGEETQVCVEELRLARMKRSILKREAVWEIDCSFVPLPLLEGERAMFPKLLLLVDQGSGQILRTAVRSRQRIGQETVDALLDTMEGLGIIPSRMEALTEEAFHSIGSLLEYFEIEAYLTSELPALEEAKDGMLMGLLGQD